MVAAGLVAVALLLPAPPAAGLRARAPGPSDLDIWAGADRGSGRLHARSAGALKRELAARLKPLLPEAMYTDPNKVVMSVNTMGFWPKLPAYVANMVECRMGEGDESSCPLSSLSRQSITKVFPGGRTRCIFGKDFFFEVVPGDSDKLLLTMQGGGACWDEITTVTATSCFTSAYDAYFMGPRNLCGDSPFENYTTVLVSHCSGDMHGGNITQPYPNPDDPSVPIEHHGYDNVKSVLAWIKANMDTKLSHLALHGESAGGIGLQVWSSDFLTELRYDRAEVLIDSYAGVFPEKFQTHVFQSVGACKTVLATGELHEMCVNGSITIPDVFEHTIKAFPNVIFGSINSKHDAVQTTFYQIAAISLRIAEVEAWCGTTDPDKCDLSAVPEKWQTVPERIDHIQFHERMEAIVERYSKLPNYVSYTLSANTHVPTTFLFGDCEGLDYGKGNGMSRFLDGRDGAQRSGLQNWTRSFFEPSRSKRSVCERLDDDGDDWCRDAQELKTSS